MRRNRLLRCLQVEWMNVNVKGYTSRVERRIEVRDCRPSVQLDQRQRSRIAPTRKEESC